MLGRGEEGSGWCCVCKFAVVGCLLPFSLLIFCLPQPCRTQRNTHTLTHTHTFFSDTLPLAVRSTDVSQQMLAISVAGHVGCHDWAPVSRDGSKPFSVGACVCGWRGEGAEHLQSHKYKVWGEEGKNDSLTLTLLHSLLHSFTSLLHSQPAPLHPLSPPPS